MENNQLENSKKLVAAVVKMLQTATKFQTASTKGPFEYYSTFKGFKQLSSHLADNLENIIVSILKKRGISSSFGSHEELFDMIKNYNINTLDRVGILLDQVEGIRLATAEQNAILEKARIPISTSWNKPVEGTEGQQTEQDQMPVNVPRPQVIHKWTIDNSSSAFLPPIRFKPHSIKPLAFLLETQDNGVEFYAHPYEVELEAFKPSKEFLQRSEPKVPKPLEETYFEYIDTEEAFLKLCKKLETVSELAVDLEHHSFRSFLGFTCLMQMSTRTEDYIVDAIKLRDSMHHLLEIFANPKILKVFHGADCDIHWLQRDFGLYVVNMFDTGQASRVLAYPNFSLNYLVHKFCNIQLDKKFQLADWRVRPLSSQMLLYARMDTHFLLYIYDLMKNELLDREVDAQNGLCAVYTRSKDICLKRYDKPQLLEDSHLIFSQRYQKKFNRKQMEALKNLYAWRDRIAREKDESFSYVLPNHMLLQIAQNLPRDPQGILACCSRVPALVKQYLQELHHIVYKARAISLDRPEEEARDDLETQKQVFSFDQGKARYYVPYDLYLKDGSQRDDYNEELFDNSKEMVPVKNRSDLILASAQKPLPTIQGYMTPYDMYLKQLEYEEKLEELLKASREAEPETRPLCNPPKSEAPVSVASNQLKGVDDGPQFKTLPESQHKNKRQKRLDRSQTGQFKPFNYETAVVSSEKSAVQNTTMKNKRKNDYDPYKSTPEFKGGKRKVFKNKQKSAVL